VDTDEHKLLYSILVLLFIENNQVRLKVAAAERVLQEDSRLYEKYQFVLQSLRADRSVTAIETALEVLRQKFHLDKGLALDTSQL
jgi:hypothetical protein